MAGQPLSAIWGVLIGYIECPDGAPAISSFGLFWEYSAPQLYLFSCRNVIRLVLSLYLFLISDFSVYPNISLSQTSTLLSSLSFLSLTACDKQNHVGSRSPPIPYSLLSSGTGRVSYSVCTAGYGLCLLQWVGSSHVY